MSCTNKRLEEIFKKRKVTANEVMNILNHSMSIQKEHIEGHVVPCYNCEVCNCERNKLRHEE